MSGFLKTVGSLFVYKEPKNIELGFELLENKNEGNSHAQTSTQPQPASSSTDKKSTSCEQQSSTDPISDDLQNNLSMIKQRFGIPKNQDIIIREFVIGRKIKCFMVYVDGMIDKQTLNLSIFPSLMAKELGDELDDKCPIEYLINNVLAVHGVSKEKSSKNIIMQILNGMSGLFLEGCSECILLETRGYEKRSVEAPKTEPVVKGSQEGFTENLRTNITLLRRIIKTEKLVTEMLPIGKTSCSNCVILYLDGIANINVINEVKKRILRIDTDYVLGEGMIEQFIEDNSFMLFPQVMSTERPDRTASFIMEGQVVIMAEGTPFSMAVPVTFFRLLHTSEDSFIRWPYGFFLRMIRMLGLFCATLLPGLYISIVMFHPEMIPTELLSSITEAKETVPFPTLLEVFIMEMSFELIREGAIRVPSMIGQTLGIVGALILGQAAVSAGLISPILVIIVSVTALGSFAIPNYNLSLAVRIERFFFIVAGAFLGFYGITLMFFAITCIACSMKSFGVPFFTPVAPRTSVNPDIILKTPIWAQKHRPDPFQVTDPVRQGQNVKNWTKEDHPNEKGGEG